MKFLLLAPIALSTLLASGAACADGYTYQVTLPDHRVQVIHSDESGVAHMTIQRSYTYVASVSHLSLSDWKRLEGNQQLPSYDVVKCDDATCWYATQSKAELGNEVDISTNGPEQERLTQVSVVESFVDSSMPGNASGQPIDVTLPRITTLSTKAYIKPVLNQPFTVDTPSGQVNVVMLETPEHVSLSKAVQGVVVTSQ